MKTPRPPLYERLKAGMEESIQYFRGEISLVVHEFEIPDAPPNYTAEEVKAIRAKLHMSQPRFSKLVNVSYKTVQSWEQGTRHPSQSSARLLQFIADPQLLLAMAGQGENHSASG